MRSRPCCADNESVPSVNPLALKLQRNRPGILERSINIIEEVGLVQALQMLIERSNIPGRLRCNFSAKGFTEGTLSLSAQQGLLRIAQEAISNALRHAKPTIVSVSLKGDATLTTLEIRDNGLGVDSTQLETAEGLGITSMRERAKQLDAQLDIRSAPGHGTTVTVRLPLAVISERREK